MKEGKEYTLNDLKREIADYKETNKLNDAKLKKDLKPILLDLRFFSIKRFKGFYDELRESFSIFENGFWRGLFSIFLALLFIVFLGIIVPLVLLSMYIDSGYVIGCLWIITMLALVLAIYYKDHMWSRVAVISFSLSVGLFTSYLYEEHLSKSDKNAVDEINITVDEMNITGQIDATNKDRIIENLISGSIDYELISIERTPSVEDNKEGKDIIGLTLGVAAIMIAIFETLSGGINKRRKQKNV